MEDGTRIRYAGEGDAGRGGGPKGDLYVVLSVRPHDFFERHGYDLHCVIPISFPQAALGAEFEIPGIDGPVNLKIPEGTQSGRELRVRGRGVPYLNEKGHGDLIVKVVVQIPRKLNRGQRELVTQTVRDAGGGQQAGFAGADGEDERPVQLESGPEVSGPRFTQGGQSLGTSSYSKRKILAKRMGGGESHVVDCQWFKCSHARFVQGAKCSLIGLRLGYECSPERVYF